MTFYLLDLDKGLEKMDIKYFRYLDDILILAPSRWKLRKAIRVLSRTFNELKLEKHPGKTVIGRIEKGFDFLGFHFSPEGLGIARKSIENFVSHAVRLYEQEPGEALVPSRLGLYVYVVRWVRWVRGIAPRTRFPHIEQIEWSLLCMQLNLPGAPGVS